MKYSKMTAFYKCLSAAGILKLLVLTVSSYLALLGVFRGLELSYYDVVFEVATFIFGSVLLAIFFYVSSQWINYNSNCGEGPRSSITRR